MTNDSAALTSPHLDFEQSVPVLLGLVRDRLNATGSAIFRQRFGIGLSEFRLLSILAVESDILAARACELVGINNGAGSRALRSLHARALVEQRPDDQNKAYGRWSITPAGREIHNKALGTAFERERILTTDLSRAERVLLIDMLKRMLKRTDDLARLVTTPTFGADF